MANQIPPPYPDYQQHFEEDEINLLDYVIVLLKHKWLIFGTVFLTGVAAVIISLLLPNIYRSEATIVPRQQEKSGTSSALSALGGLGGIAGELAGLGGGGDVEKFEVVLESRELARRVVNKYKLLPKLFAEKWDADNERWLENPAPTHQDAYKALKGMLTISRDRNSDVLTIQLDHEEPEFAKNMVDHYLAELSETLREQTLKDAGENQRFLKHQLEKTSDVLLKERIAELLAKEIEKETFARAQKYYSFNVLDPPIVPDLNKKVRPKRSLICILSVTVAGFFAIFLAFFVEYVHNVKSNEDEERLGSLRRYLRLRSPGDQKTEDTEQTTE
ncbi:MAG: Wzz/FepE/Etk N-terminal domain-containing protein [Syntrophobacteria bacterium]